MLSHTPDSNTTMVITIKKSGKVENILISRQGAGRFAYSQTSKTSTN
ncbi:hypothetical protein M5D96_000870, partial [Drosophila gunungcola]